jgi:hypothetical protein
MNETQAVETIVRCRILGFSPDQGVSSIWIIAVSVLFNLSDGIILTRRLILRFAKKTDEG